MARKIVITSGKGGVGKTSVMANLGARLATMGKRVCLVDMDFGLNNLDVVMGVESLIVYDIVDCIEGKCRAKQALIESPDRKNLYILPSVHSFTKSQVSPENIKELFTSIDASFDFIFLDCPAGIDAGFHRAVSVCDEAFVVTTPQLSSLRDADKVLSILRSYSLLSVSVIINRVRGDLVVEGMTLSPEEIENVLKTEVIGIVPEDDGVFLYNAGNIPPELEASKAFRLLAANVIGGKNKIYNYAKNYVGFFGSIRRGLKKNL